MCPVFRVDCHDHGNYHDMHTNVTLLCHTSRRLLEQLAQPRGPAVRGVIVVQVQLSIQPTFQWKDRAHCNDMRWHIWVEDSENEHIYHSETWLPTKKMMLEPAHTVAFTIPIFEPLLPQYIRYVLFSVLSRIKFVLCSGN